MKKKLGEKGFSLVELLVGVTILAVIAVPLLTAFLVTSHTSNRAKDVRNQTVAAQNLVESMKATSIGAVIDDLKRQIMPFGAGSAELYTRIWNPDTKAFDETLVSDYGSVAADGQGYTLKLTNVPVNNKTYNATIYLNAAKYQGTTDDPGLNDAPIVNYKEMDAVFKQPKDGTEDPDSMAASDLAFQSMVATGEEVSSDDVYNSMDRTIEIAIHKDAGQSDIVSYTAKYKYHYKDNGTDYESEFSYSIYRGSYSADKNGLYVFFYPLHSSDRLCIYNTDNLDVRVFLIKQGPDDTYNPSINLYEAKYSNDQNPVASIYFNLNNNSGNSGAIYPYSYHPGTPIGSGEYMYSWNYEKKYSARLVDTSVPNRIYEIKVELYKPGSFTNPVAAFDTSAQANG